MSEQVPVKSKAKSKKEPMLPKAGIARLLKAGAAAGSGNRDIRVSSSKKDNAVGNTRKIIHNLLSDLADNLVSALKQAKRKTVSADDVDMVLKNMGRRGLAQKARNPTILEKGKRSDIPLESLVKVLKKKMGSDYRVSNDARTVLRAAAEAAVIELGTHAGRVAVASKRKTVKARDVAVAASFQC